MTLEQAAANYRTALAEYQEAREHSRMVRNVNGGSLRDWQRANDVAQSMRRECEAARDQLVAAALEHTGV